MKKLYGKIVLKSGLKTKVVQIKQVKHHPIYLKKITKLTKIKAHDEKDEFQIGDSVEIASVRPLSQKKSWKIQRKIL